jgi:V/A-type H+-transporting ATPase subunit I
LETIPTGVWNEVYRVTEKTSVTVYGELLAHEQDAHHVSEFMKALDAQEVVLPLGKHETLNAYYKYLEQEKKQADKALAQQIQNATEMLPLHTKIMFAYDALLHKIEREKAEEKIAAGSFITIINGWIPAIWFPMFKEKLHRAFPMAAIEAIDVPREDRAPVMFQNNKLVRPFEAVTDLYGKPAYHEVDPSGPLALFFLISFGLALTDAGYGVVMMIGTFIAERFFTLKKDMQKLVRVLFYAGAATVALGGVTGGWFSINLDALPEGAIKHFFLGIKLLDPLKQPILLLGIIFAFGIVQLMYAWVVRGIYHWNRGEKSIAIMDDFSWVAMVLSIIGWQACSHITSLSTYAQFAKYFMYAVGLFMIATQGRAAKNIFVKIGNGALSLYGLIAFVSDMLSYSRLLALGLATGIIGLVVNLIAGMVWAIPVVGVLAGIIVLIGGHVFNLGINALGGYIHSGRLQFVEFFPKFLEGGGLPFRPFGRVSKYVDNPKDYVKIL